MKLFGNTPSRKRKKKGGAHAKSTPKSNKLLRTLVIFCSVVLALGIAGVAYYKTSVKPPDIPPKPNTDNSQQNPGNNDADPDTNVPDDPGKDDTNKDNDNTEDKEFKVTRYTFLVAGMDDGNGNTDTIMVASFDSANYTLDVVSIPRDTLVNVSWAVKKVNTLYGGSKIDRFKEGISDLLGFDIGFYAIVDIDAFVKVIDAIGGVDYYVPQDMKYDDPAQDLHIDFKKGQQRIKGKDAIKLMRFRSGYADADIGRIDTQQDFLKTAASQMLSNVNEIPLTTLIDIILNDFKTDLTYGNLIWFAQEFFKMDAENVNFHVLPVNSDDRFYQGGKWISYCTIYVDEWIELINDVLNPYEEPVEVSDLNIVTRDSNNKLYATNGNMQFSATWGKGPAGGSSSGSSGNSSGSGSSSGGQTQTPPPTTEDPPVTGDDPATGDDPVTDDPTTGGEEDPGTQPPDEGDDGTTEPPDDTGSQPEGGDTPADEPTQSGDAPADPPAEPPADTEQ